MRIFEDRLDAAEVLAWELAPLRREHPLVLAVPRGAVPMAEHLARTLEGDLDVVLSAKIRDPRNPECALGAVAEGQAPLWNGLPPRYLSRAWLRRCVAEARDRVARSRALYTPARGPLPVSGRCVLVVDDGVATGATLAASLRGLRAQAPRQLYAAAAVAPRGALRRLRAECDGVLALKTPEAFRCVGDWFVDFSEVSDQEVVEALERAGRRSQASGAAVLSAVGAPEGRHPRRET